MHVMFTGCKCKNLIGSFHSMSVHPVIICPIMLFCACMFYTYHLGRYKSSDPFIYQGQTCLYSSYISRLCRMMPSEAMFWPTLEMRSYWHFQRRILCPTILANRLTSSMQRQGMENCSGLLHKRVKLRNTWQKLESNKNPSLIWYVTEYECLISNVILFQKSNVKWNHLMKLGHLREEAVERVKNIVFSHLDFLFNHNILTIELTKSSWMRKSSSKVNSNSGSPLNTITGCRVWTIVFTFTRRMLLYRPNLSWYYLDNINIRISKEEKRNIDKV